MRIARRKRPLALLRMFADLAASTSVPLHLTVVGDGPQRDRFAAAARRRGLADRITVTGRVEPNEVLRRLGDADIYVAPAVLESFGLAALEARCVGLPVVGHSASGLSDFIRNGVEGWLSPTDETIVERLRLLVEDDDLRLRISEHNRTTPSELTWTHSIDRHDRAYDIAGSRSLSSRPGLLAWGAR
jgi:glycosyltransferase involved in cell wall biosynthesis